MNMADHELTFSAHTVQAKFMACLAYPLEKKGCQYPISLAQQTCLFCGLFAGPGLVRLEKVTTKVDAPAANLVQSRTHRHL